MQSWVPLDALLLSVGGVDERSWKIVSAAKEAPLPPRAEWAGVSVGAMGCQDLVRLAVEAASFRAGPNSSFRMLAIRQLMLS